MASLYELSNEMRSLLDMAEEGDEGFALALTDTVSSYDEMVEDKIEATMFVVKELEADAEACKAEAKRLMDRAKRLEGNAATCKQRVIDVMQQLDKPKIKRPLISLTLAKPRKSVSIVDAEKIPSEYTKLIPASRQPVKADILKALNAGIEVQGCELAEGKPSLRIS